MKNIKVQVKKKYLYIGKFNITNKSSYSYEEKKKNSTKWNKKKKNK